LGKRSKKTEASELLHCGMQQSSHALGSANAQEPWCVAARKKAVARSKTPKALAKHAAKLRGRPPPQRVVEAARLARLGMGTRPRLAVK
jgi:hypothetical protein